MIHTYFQKAQKWARILSRIPTVEAIFLSGSLATGKATKESDIDFFIIAQRGTIWITRFWVFVILKLSGQMAKPHRHAGKICPNHFITRDTLRLREHNLYSARLFTANQPLYDPQGLFYAFAKANQSWVEAFGCRFPFEKILPDGPRTKKRPWTRKMLAWFLRGDEIWMRMGQRWKINQNPETRQPRSYVVLTDQELRFHPIAKSLSPDA